MFCVEVGEKLALARRYHTPSLTQEDLAKVLGVDRASIGRWESKNHIPPDKLPRVAALLNVREEWFYNQDETPPTLNRRVPQDEPQNIKPLAVHELNRTDRYLAEGLEVALPVWRGVSAGSEDETYFVEPDSPEYRQVPLYLTLGQPEHHVLCVATGMSMAPRIAHTERALARFSPDVPPGHIVIAQNPDAKRFIKKLLRSGSKLELHSLNEGYRPIEYPEGWQVVAGITAILHHYEPGVPNIEFDEGRWLRA